MVIMFQFSVNVNVQCSLVVRFCVYSRLSCRILYPSIGSDQRQCICVLVYLCICVFVYQAWYLNGIPLLLNSCQRGAPPNILITLNIVPHEWKAYSALFHKYLSKHPFINSYLGRFWILAQQIPHNYPGIVFEQARKLQATLDRNYYQPTH